MDTVEYCAQCARVKVSGASFFEESGSLRLSLQLAVFANVHSNGHTVSRRWNSTSIVTFPKDAVEEFLVVRTNCPTQSSSISYSFT